MAETKEDVMVNKERLGEIRGVIVCLYKFDHELITLLSKTFMKSREYIIERMRYNVWTMKQFADLTKKSVPTITNMTNRPIILDDGQVGVALNHCYPFPGEDHTGPRFIFRDEKSMKYLQQCL